MESSDASVYTYGAFCVMLPFVLVATFWRLSEDNTDPLSEFDKDKDGSLDRDEFKDAVHVSNAKDKHHVYEPLSDEEVSKVFEELDTDKSSAYQLSLSGC